MTASLALMAAPVALAGCMNTGSLFVSPPQGGTGPVVSQTVETARTIQVNQMNQVDDEMATLDSALTALGPNS